MLSSFHVKLIAMVAMIIDHLGLVFFQDSFWMRMIGRIAMPLFVFMTVEGYRKTRNLRVYEVRMAVAGVLMILGNKFVENVTGFKVSNNMFLTLLIVLVFLELLDKKSVLVVVPLFLVNWVEYGILSLLVAMVFRLFEGRRMVVSFVVVSLLAGLIFKYQYMMLLSLPFVLLYGGKKGPGLKWFFYVFYPIHLWVLYLVKWRCAL